MSEKSSTFAAAKEKEAILKEKNAIKKREEAILKEKNAIKKTEELWYRF